MKSKLLFRNWRTCQFISIHSQPTNHLAELLALARIYKLSSYDAAYLELSIREGLSLATLDKNLLKAAKKADIGIYTRSA